MTTDIIVPAEQEGTKAVVKHWLKKPGDPVRVNDPLVEIETDKVAVEIAAVADGVLSEILAEAGAEIGPGRVLGRIAESTATPVQSPMSAGAGVAARNPQGIRPASDESQLPPGVRRLLAEHNLKSNEVPISGDRLTREDIQAELDRRAKGPEPGVTRVPHDSMRRRIAEHMSQSMRAAPHVTAMFEADFGAIAAHRNAHKTEFESAGVNLTFTAYLVAASAAAMMAAPMVNGRWFEDRVEIYDDINIGIGTALGDKGLVVPVVHRAQALSLFDIARRLTDVTERARAGRLAPADVQNGTFSISNHGVSGSLLAAPVIINQPQSAILGVGKLQKRAVVRGAAGEERVEVRPMAYVTLTIDHRVLDAHQTNSWLSRFVETLERWPR